jgi:hypothetical protein
MARRQKISQMTPKGANLQATDLLEISELSGTGYITKSITGQEIINAASGGGGSQDLQQVTDIGATTTNAIQITHNGSTDTLTATHSSGSGIGLLITKGGANEGLKVNKTSGSGNAATIIGTLEATTLVKTGGTSSEYLMADGSTNTLDQASILSLLGFWQYNRVAESTAVTGTTAETIIQNITIPANTYLNGGILRLYNIKFRKVGTVAGTVLKIYIGPNANNLSGATQIAVLNTTPSTLTTEILRTFTCFTNAIVGFNAGSSAVSDVTNNTLARTQTTVDWTIAQNIIITSQTGVLSADSITLIGASAKNF